MPITTLNCTQNVTISSKYSYNSYRNGYLGFGRGGGNDEYRLLLNFSAAASVIPSGATVESAILTVPKVTGSIGSNAGFTVTANRITSAWSENSTWDNGHPSYTDAGVITAATGEGHSGNINFDVTAMVQAWVNGSAQYGILLRKATNGGVYIKVAQEHGAYITVTYGYKASTFSTDGSAVAGTAENISVSAQSSSLTHDLTLTFGSGSWLLASKVTAANLKSWTPPMAVCNQIPNATSGNGTLTLTTYNGNTPVGSVQASVMISVPSSVVPTVSGLSAAIAGNAAAAGWGVYVMHHSKVMLTASGATGAYDSGIRSYNFSGNGWSTSVDGNNAESATLVSAGDVTFSVTVTDTRGRTSAAKTVTVNVANYAAPSFSSLSVVRADANGNPAADGTYILVTASASYSAVGNNGVSITASVSPGGWSGTLANGRLLLGGGGVDITKIYTVVITATDSLGGRDQRTTTIYTAKRLINVTADGSGVAVGGFAEKGKFTVWLPARMPESRRYQVASGFLWNGGTANSTIQGHGTATVDIAPNGIARIDFSLRVTTAGTIAAQYYHGLNRDLLTANNPAIPQITPLFGGICTIYDVEGRVHDGYMDWGGLMSPYGDQFWLPTRIYTTGGNYGGWGEDRFAEGMRIIGTCYGTVEL